MLALVMQMHLRHLSWLLVNHPLVHLRLDQLLPPLVLHPLLALLLELLVILERRVRLELLARVMNTLRTTKAWIRTTTALLLS